MTKVFKFLGVVSIAIFAILFFHATQACTAEEVEDEKEFSYKKGSKDGPERWGMIHKDWAICGKGQMQSPIDLSPKRVQVARHLGPLRRSYSPASAIMKNRGHDIMIEWKEDAGSIRINGTEYKLKQLHWHTPSEHTINGRRYAMEMHMVHESADKKIAVVGVLYEIGRPDSFLSKMESYIKKVDGMKDREEKLGMVDPRGIDWGTMNYYRYMGSLTTPPCTEGVVWTIVRKVQTVSWRQLNLLKEAVHDHTEMNARPIQLIHDRVIGLYRPGWKSQH